MLKILVDGTAIRPKPSGIGLYAYHLIEGLSKLQSAEQFELHISYQPSVRNWLQGNLSVPEKIKDYSNIHCLPIPVSLSNLLARYPNPLSAYFEQYLDLPNIIHGTDHVVYPYRNSLKVITIHDLTVIKHPNLVSSIVKTYTKRIKQCLKWTDLVITVSESSKRDIVNYLGVDRNQIYVTPLASRYFSHQSQPLSSHLENYYNFSQPYLLFVSTLQPRKNIINLVKAFNFFKEKYKTEHNLVLIGQKGWRYEPIFETIENSPFRDSIYHLNYLPDELVTQFYIQADVFVYPSIYEGFGLPVLEAMTLGSPVVTSNTSSLPEVTGDAAILINPYEPIEIAEAIFKIISDSQFRRQLIEKGKKRATLFSWQRTAKETLNAYRSLL